MTSLALFFAAWKFKPMAARGKRSALNENIFRHNLVLGLYQCVQCR